MISHFDAVMPKRRVKIQGNHLFISVDVYEILSIYKCRFVEFGEFWGNLYGTSYASI